jgi:hypothetical protein
MRIVFYHAQENRKERARTLLVKWHFLKEGLARKNQKEKHKQVLWFSIAY